MDVDEVQVGAAEVENTSKCFNEEVLGLVPAAQKGAGSDLFDRARYQDISRRMLSGQSPAQIARAYGVNPTTIRRVTRDPEFVALHEKVERDIYENVDETIKNEKLAPMLRTAAAANRGLTVLAETMEIARKHMSDYRDGMIGKVNAQLLRVGVEAATQVMVRDKDQKGEHGGHPMTAVNVLVVPERAGALLRNTLEESGLDLNDVIDGYAHRALPAAKVLDAEAL
jgi:hypothetical protein